MRRVTGASCPRKVLKGMNRSVNCPLIAPSAPSLAPAPQHEPKAIFIQCGTEHGTRI